jgi:hypothetical protein
MSGLDVRMRDFDAAASVDLRKLRFNNVATVRRHRATHRRFEIELG